MKTLLVFAGIGLAALVLATLLSRRCWPANTPVAGPPTPRRVFVAMTLVMVVGALCWALAGFCWGQGWYVPAVLAGWVGILNMSLAWALMVALRRLNRGTYADPGERAAARRGPHRAVPARRSRD